MQSDQFRLGELVTEQPHPETIGLAEMAQTDLYRALDSFQRVDRMAMDRLQASLAPLPDLTESIRDTLRSGNRVYIAGCGATGRLALSLETFAREAWLDRGMEDRIVAFMAGGDAALIRSIESFEDYPDFGRRQLRELGFGNDDLLIAITEGGETPWVIGACLEAADRSTRNPWFIFCNPPALLRRLARRCGEVLDHPMVRPFFLDIGPMALAGSTRLQATTTQMLVAGAALCQALGRSSAVDLIEEFHQLLGGLDYTRLAPFTEAEATVYRKGDHVLYSTDRYGITVLTDTTERSPTFSINPFENRDRPEEPPSGCYLCQQGFSDSASAWTLLLGRPPRTLDWEEFRTRASLETLLGYDISEQAPDWRAQRHPDKRHYPFLVHQDSVVLEFAGHRIDLGLEDRPVLVRHLILKCLLNAHSTLLMGRLGLFESNLMTHVKASNYKLIDRAARHAQHHHRQKTGTDLPYEEAVRLVFSRLK